MTGINKFFIWSTLFLLTFCETTGDLRNRGQARRDGDEEIQTVENPAIVKSTNPDLERELAVTKGRLLEIETLREQERLAYTDQISQLEKQREELLKALENARIAASTSEKAEPTPPSQSAPENTDGFKVIWDQAFAQIKTKNYDSAASLFEEAVKRYPKKTGVFYAHLGHGLALYSSGNFKEAAIVFNDILDKYPKNKNRSIANFGLGASFAMMKQNKDAKLFFEEVKSSSAKSAHGVLASGIISGKTKVPRDLFVALPKWYQ